MKVIARPVGTGKTKELLLAAQAANGIVLTGNKRGLQAKAQAYGIPKIEIVDWDDLIYGRFDKDKTLYVHKMDDVMEEYFWDDFGIKLGGYSIAMEKSDGV